MECTKPDGAGIICKCNKQDSDYFLCVLGNAAGKWGFPKGYLEVNEKARERASKELAEETGLHVTLSGVEDTFRARYIYFIVNFLELDEPISKDKHEIRCVRWISLRELLGKDQQMLNTDMRAFLASFQTDDGFETVHAKKRPLAYCRKANKQILNFTKCKNYMSSIGCRFGDKCRFSHDL
tara:strand:- start:3310 stop:3852 length:543 start_codon:yes stop_codon:yes gene_type:complete